MSIKIKGDGMRFPVLCGPISGRIFFPAFSPYEVEIDLALDILHAIYDPRPRLPFPSYCDQIPMSLIRFHMKDRRLPDIKILPSTDLEFIWLKIPVVFVKEQAVKVICCRACRPIYRTGVFLIKGITIFSLTAMQLSASHMESDRDKIPPDRVVSGISRNKRII